MFARAGEDAGGSGRSDDPYTRLQDAIDHAEGRKVCACADKAFAEAVTLRAGIEVHGGYTCNGEWEKSADKKSAIVGPAGQVALTLTGEAGGAKVQGFEIRAADATEPGASSIAVAVADIAAELTQIDVLAGNGRVGEDGVAETGTAAAGAGAPAGNAEGAPTAAWITTAPMGGKPGRTTCDGVDTDGGAGGHGGLPPALGTDSRGRPGEAGKPDPEAMVNGNGGTIDIAGYGQDGSNGARRGNGGAGDGGHGGRLTLAGITDGDGARGKPGNAGQGGGGGAGSNMLSITRHGNGAGASGGGGGAGGCGGRGGAGGKAGGSSIGIISLGTRLVLSEVSVTLGEGGKGGDGAAGQEGGPGGLGAPGGVNASDPDHRYAGTGGNGSDGGRGGPGGGGRGGHAIGIAYDADRVAMPSLTPFSPGAPGAGGLSGPSVSSRAGDHGEGAACWNFKTGTSCTP
ncbi:hypothetical protein [Sorangium sp. So ce887]|uniref:hypothetical protein n=1 Tax=Sorangium sp. So ce887 TaxID=3133324 RepID=UPI003F610493